MKLTTAGESHGKALIAVIEGLPAHLEIDVGQIDRELALRQSGFGRGARQKIEADRAEILTGVRNGETLGSPVTLCIYNKDYENWRPYMSDGACDVSARTVTRVRPGHADLSGMLKFGGTKHGSILVFVLKKNRRRFLSRAADRTFGRGGLRKEARRRI